MVGSKDLPPSGIPFFPNVFWNNQFREKPRYPPPGTSIAGQTAIVTGGNVGLGYEAARQLLDLNLSHLILAVRSPARGDDAAAALRKKHSKATIDVWNLDMSEYDSVRAFARRVDAELPRIDMVLLNAGRARAEYTKLASGHEEVLQVNYLSTMLLAVLLLPVLKAKGPPSRPARLTISSAALTLHAAFPQRSANPLLPALDDPHNFHQRETYNTSKLLAHFFLWKLVDCVSADDVIVNLADPAFVRGTSLARDIKGVLPRTIFRVFGLVFGRTPQVGASCYIDAMVNKGKEAHGCFLMSWQVHPFAAFLYTPEGKVVIERVWNETLDELDFAGVRGILSSKTI